MVGPVEKPTLSVCLIVRNNEDTIRQCVSSIAPWVDEIIVVDTGSTDRTPEIVVEYGAKLSHFPWCDDFSAARNESLRRATGTWLFWMDSDDTISTENGRRLQTLAKDSGHGSPMAYIMQVHCPESSDGTSMTVVDHVKMFRNLPELRFEGRIHEQILPAIRRLDGDVAWTDIFVEHTGSDLSREGRQLKYERDLKLLGLELADHPDHPFALFNLGMTYADMEDFEKAVPALVRSLEVAGPDESHVRKAYALLIGSLMQLDRTIEAHHWCSRGRRLFPDDLELAFRDGIIQHQQGHLEAAIHAYQEALLPREAKYFSSVDNGIRGFKARHNLALVLCDAGRFSDAENEWRQVIDEAPRFEPGWTGLVDALIEQNKPDEAKSLVQASDILNRAFAEILLSRIAESQGDLNLARSLLESSYERSFGSIDSLQALAKFLFQHGPPSSAIAAQSRLATLTPSNGAVYHNLATLYLQAGCVTEAVRFYTLSIELRPNSVSTHLQLGFCLESRNDLGAARQAYLRAIEVFPDNPDLIQSLTRLASKQ